MLVIIALSLSVVNVGADSFASMVIYATFGSVVFLPDDHKHD